MKAIWTLNNAYNPIAAENVMCIDTISVDWEGYLYDCDFNQMLQLKIQGKRQHVSDFNKEELLKRSIIIGQHCYGCTAGSGYPSEQLHLPELLKVV